MGWMHVGLGGLLRGLAADSCNFLLAELSKSVSCEVSSRRRRRWVK